MTVGLVARIRSGGVSDTVAHYVGLPPVLTGGSDERVRLPRGELVVIV